MHENANIAFAQKEIFTLFEHLLKLLPKSKGEALTGTNASNSTAPKSPLTSILSTIQRQMPQPMSIQEVLTKYPIDYAESMSTVLVQEISRYNRLLLVIHESLQSAQKALSGLVVMSEPLEALCNSISLNSVPPLWAAKAHPSLKPLSSWVLDLVARIAFLQEWVNTGIPKVFWISGFFFPQAFLTGTLQNYARKHKLPIDQLSFEFKVQSTACTPFTSRFSTMNPSSKSPRTAAISADYSSKGRVGTMQRNSWTNPNPKSCTRRFQSST